MKNTVLAAFAATVMLSGAAIAQDVAIPTGPAASNSGQNSADPTMVEGAATYGAVDVLTVPSVSEGMMVNAIPTSPQAENGGQNSADPAASAAMGSTVGPNVAMGGVESGSVPTSPAAENDGEQSADPAS